MNLSNETAMVRRSGQQQNKVVGPDTGEVIADVIGTVRCRIGLKTL